MFQPKRPKGRSLFFLRDFPVLAAPSPVAKIVQSHERTALFISRTYPRTKYREFRCSLVSRYSLSPLVKLESWGYATFIRLFSFLARLRQSGKQNWHSTKITPPSSLFRCSMRNSTLSEWLDRKRSIYCTKLNTNWPSYFESRYYDFACSLL